MSVGSALYLASYFMIDGLLHYMTNDFPLA
jgi:hypothetical protein